MWGVPGTLGHKVELRSGVTRTGCAVALAVTGFRESPLVVGREPEWSRGPDAPPQDVGDMGGAGLGLHMWTSLWTVGGGWGDGGAGGSGTRCWDDRQGAGDG